MPSAKEPVRIAVLVSGGGSNLQALLDAAKRKELPGAEIALVVSSKADAYALERAKRAGVPTAVNERNAFATEAAFEQALDACLLKARIDVVCLAGYLRKIAPSLVQRFRGRMLNIHPALLPKYGGAGMYGRFVHEAVIAAKEKESGCSVHLVDEEFDHGPVLAQARVPVLPADSPESLAARILEQEHKLYPETLRKFIQTL